LVFIVRDEEARKSRQELLDGVIKRLQEPERKGGEG
jgi:hypothetical protein